MQKYINITLGIIIVLLLSYFLLYSDNSIKEYSKKFTTLNKNIVVKIYSKDSKKANNALIEIEKIYNEYDQLINNKKSYKNMTNIYDLNNSDKEYITINQKLYNLIDYGKAWYNKSNNLVNINQNNINNIWEEYIKDKSGVPKKEELINKTNPNDIIIENNKIKNENLNINLNLIARSYVTNEVKKYLKSININSYLINIGGTILVGNHYNNDDYKIGIENPNEKDDVIKIIHGNNIGVVTLGNYEEYYDYENIRYNNIINPNTMYPANNMKSITVISKNIKDLSAIANMLFLMTIEDGKKYVLEINDLEAIWISNDNTIITSSGVNKYE